MASNHSSQLMRVFQQFYSKLVETLPMDDAVFIAKLFSNDLLPADLKNQLKLLHRTSADKAVLFLDSVIEPSVTSDGDSSFDKLLNVMEGSEYQHVKKLAKQITEIKTNLRKRSEISGVQSTTSEPTIENMKSSPIDVRRLKSRYLRLLPRAKNIVMEYVRLAIVEKEDVTLRDENLNEVTQLTLQGDVDRILKKKQPLGDLREIFHYQDEPCPRLIVIMGGPGIGKTTLAHEICMRWARDGFLSEDFDAVALIPLRCVQQRSLEEVMIEYIGEEIYQLFKKSAGNRCLIILEGLDEMAADRQKSDQFFIRLIKDSTILEEATVMITSRPQACDKLKADRQVEVVGFDEDKIKEFIKKSFPNDQHSVSELLKQLNDYPHLKSLCYVPQNLVMIINIFKCRQKKLPSRLTELYKLFLVMTLERQDMKEDQMYSFADAPLLDNNSKNLIMMLPEIPINAIGTLFLLCKLSFCGFFDWHVDVQEKHWSGRKKWKDPKIIFTIEDLKQCGIDVTHHFDGHSLLKATHINAVPRDTSTYNFSHLTIQEFLSSLYISLLPQQQQLRLINEHFHDFPNIFIFLCGLTRLQCNEMYQIIYSKLMSDDDDDDNDDVILVVRCIHESDCPVQSTVLFTLDIKYKDVQPFDCYCISYMISHYPISQLKMNNCHMGDTGVEMLAKYYSDESTTVKSLQLLNLSWNALTTVGMVHVMNIVMTNSTTLRELKVSGNHIGDNGISVIIKGLQTNETFTKLNVTLCNFTEEGAIFLGELLKVNNSLQELVMGYNDIGDGGISSVADGLQHNKSLTKLNVSRCEASVKGASCLGELLKVNNSLQELDMWGNDIGEDGMSSVADGLQHNKTLTKLIVLECKFSVKGASCLGELLKVNNSLQELDMHNNDIGDDGMSSVADGLKHNSTLTKLNVSWCKFSVKGASCLGQLLKVNNSLQWLAIGFNPFGDDGMSSVADGLQHNKRLTKLNVSQCKFSVKGASCLGELLKVNNSLEEFEMWDNEIGDDGVSSVADGLQQNKSLTKLNVSDSKFSVKGAISISQALMVNQTLLELCMRGNEIGDDGITAIAGSLNNSNITLLDIMNCGIGLVGVTSLAAALTSNQNIRGLDLDDNEIKVDGARLIIKSAVDNGVCEDVSISSEYEDDEEIKRMMTILDDRRRQHRNNKEN